VTLVQQGGFAAMENKNEAVVKVNDLLRQINEVIVDKEQTIKLCVTCLLAGGHFLLEDRPGMGKTSLVKTISKLLGLEEQRIQFTNDLLPADILGTSIYNKNSQSFEFHQGPLFSNFVLADELNRATPKTQSACLQAMEEGRVSIDGRVFELPKPFFLIATQNPQENIGTFPLPESQLDRFLMKLHLGFPSREAEKNILKGRDRNLWIQDLKPVLMPKEVVQIIETVEEVTVSDTAISYLQDIVEKSRTLSWGLSPRAARDFNKAAKAFAFIEGRNFVIPEDYQAVGVAVMNHRLRSHEDFGDKNAEQLAQEIIHSVPIP
jgi:MoxR-like ATPase